MENIPITRRQRIGPIAEVILASIALTGILAVAVCAPNALQLLKPFFKKKKYSARRAVENSVESLVTTGLVRYSFNKEGVPILELTTKGKWESGLRHFTTIFKKKSVWDKKWRVAIFDVPNIQRNLRDELRRGMRLYGFHLLQKSVWVYPYVCDDFVKILREHLKISDAVLHMTVSEIENAKMLRKEFKL